MAFEMTEPVSDSMSERDLQRVARLEMTIALDNYLKKKRAVSMALDHNSCSVAPSASVSTVQQSQSSSKSIEAPSLQEPLRTYDEALSNVPPLLTLHA